ncbi:hypothetical protein EVAR_53052_1 [Eumeta japonica]|uniref:Uncharacterized protein n=1 Tax=Eumeta variegata TaxID=151549 RepID=A0A4C1YSE1_EUMVA|nr:hypothetical protein EVAR_53052_1 [Eumeta japonica]
MPQAPGCADPPVGRLKPKSLSVLTFNAPRNNITNLRLCVLIINNKTDHNKAECFADSIVQQCSYTCSLYDPQHVHRIEEKVRQEISFDPRTISLDEVNPTSKTQHPKGTGPGRHQK